MIRTMLGYFVMGLPFILLFGFFWSMDGLKFTLSTFGITIGCVLIVVICVILGRRILDK